MQNERQGVVTQKEETERICEKQKSISLPQNTWEMWHAGYRQDVDLHSAARSALSAHGEKREKLVSFTSTKLSAYYF